MLICIDEKPDKQALHTREWDLACGLWTQLWGLWGTFCLSTTLHWLIWMNSFSGSDIRGDASKWHECYRRCPLSVKNGFHCRPPSTINCGHEFSTSCLLAETLLFKQIFMRNYQSLSVNIFRLILFIGDDSREKTLSAKLAFRCFTHSVSLIPRTTLWG